MRVVDRGSPIATSALESEPFDEDVLHSLGCMSGDGTGVVFDALTVAIVTGIGISEMEHRL